MFPLGHFALGYLLGKITKRITGYNFNIILIWIFSILPDFDVFIPFFSHRGPSHSLFAIVISLIPVLLWFRKGLPYLASYSSHIIGDYFTFYGIQLFWPVNSNWIKANTYFLLDGQKEIILELILLLIMIFTLILSDDYKQFSFKQISIRSITSGNLRDELRLDRGLIRFQKKKMKILGNIF